MQIRPFAALPLALVLAAASCRGRGPAPPPHAPRTAILKDVPAAANSVLRDTAGTEDAERWTYTTLLPFDTTAAFYRNMLPVLGWQVMGDRSDRPGGTIDLYTRKGARTLWVHIEKQTEVVTRYTLIAADSVAASAPSTQGGRKR